MATTTAVRAGSPFAGIAQAPPDPILGLTEAFVNDPNPNKVNLGVGVYQDSSGKVPTLRVVREAERRWLEQETSKSYLPIDGVAAYNQKVQALLFGVDSPLIAEQRLVTVQALGGTGGLKIGADFLRRFFPDSEVWISTPSWENHQALFEAAGFTVNKYPYYDSATHGLAFEGMMDALRALPPKSIVVLHACCHNPTGVDLSAAQWQSVVALFQEADLIPFLDFAYQGFGESLESDRIAVDAFARAGIPFLVASSFSKSFSLYRERVGALSFVTSNADESKRVLSQVKRVIRTNYSNPSSHGAQVVALALSDAELMALWEEELTEMRERIRQMRALFVANLKERGVGQDFGFILEQRGMFSYSGLPLDVVRRLRSEYSLYIVDSGRICVAAMNETNIGYICEAIARAL
jgi:aromatic-amino-acid transaminase